MGKISNFMLEDGTELQGEPFGANISAAGEVVFNTGMVGYPETLTDPSYRGQIIVFTYPLIGNYGVPAYREDEFGFPMPFESSRIQAAGLVVSEYARNHSHYTAVRGLHKWLQDEGVPGLFGIDTRALTKRLRNHGTMLGRIERNGSEIPFYDPNATNLIASVSVDSIRRYKCCTVVNGWEPTPTVVVVDCGCKASIMRSLLRRGINVVRVPYDDYFLKFNFDGLLISNGPGDPKMCSTTVKNVERAMAVGKPILGICLGHQLLGLAAGADTYKLKFGHRSQNQPCVETCENWLEKSKPRGKCILTSQNHGYAIRAGSLPSDWKVWFKNANDGTVEGIRHSTRPYLGVQFHPEATPGPVDSEWIFDEFAALVRRSAR